VRGPPHGFLCYAATGVVISQVYGGGGNSGAPLANDFIELHNQSTAALPLDGWSVQYASATGNSYQVTRLSGTLPAGGYYLVQEAVGANTSALPLPTPDASGTIAMSATAGKVVLVSSVTALTCASAATCWSIRWRRRGIRPGGRRGAVNRHI
jgi:predicted extracellular nuclease